MVEVILTGYVVGGYRDVVARSPVLAAEQAHKWFNITLLRTESLVEIVGSGELRASFARDVGSFIIVK